MILDSHRQYEENSFQRTATQLCITHLAESKQHGRKERRRKKKQRSSRARKRVLMSRCSAAWCIMGRKTALHPSSVRAAPGPAADADAVAVRRQFVQVVKYRAGLPHACVSLISDKT